MRLRVTLQVERETMIPLNYQYQLASAVYAFLERGDADYARFLHGEGYAPLDELDEAEGKTPTRRRFKLFVFSQLRPEHSRVRGAMLHLLPGAMNWQIASPLQKFVKEFATGLLSQGTLRIGAPTLNIAAAETLPQPEFGAIMKFQCLSPIVVSAYDPARRTPRYLRPDDAEFSERVRLNLIAKYQALHGLAPADDRLNLRFDGEYLRCHQNDKHPGTKLIEYKGIRIVGVVCPLELSGSRELIEIAYNAGIGDKNAGGFGMIEVLGKGNSNA